MHSTGSVRPGSANATGRTVVLVAAALAVAASLLGSGAFGGTPIASAAEGAFGPDATLLAPAVPAFSVWSVIYLGLCSYAVWQSLPVTARNPRQRRLRYPVAASLFLNAAWILVVQADLLLLSALVILVLVAVLAFTFRICVTSGPGSALEAALCDGTLGLYLGWVCVAAAANISAVLVRTGFSGATLEPSSWAVSGLVGVTLVGLGLAAAGRGRFAPAATLIWGLVWVAVSRLTGALPSAPTAVAALAGAACIAAGTLVFRLRDSRRQRPGPARPTAPGRRGVQGKVPQ